MQAAGTALLLALLALVLASGAVLGLGLTSAAMFMLITVKGWNDPVAWVVGLLQGLVSGVYFPVALLPGWLHTLALWQPQTYALDAIRRLLLGTSGAAPLVGLGTLPPVPADLAVLAAPSLVLPATGFATFAAGLRKARADGGLCRWT